MLTFDGTETSDELLDQLRDWGNKQAWSDFFRRYDCVLEEWFREFDLDTASADEIRTNVWNELASRMLTFRYNPGKPFRGWLRTLCRYRAIDFLRKRRREYARLQSHYDSKLTSISCSLRATPVHGDIRTSKLRLDDLLLAAKRVQAAARKRVTPRSWDVFWQIAIMDRTIKIVAAEKGMSYAATFRAYARVARILKQEGDRCLAAQ
jgi:DNA-directed RNA polymerase specialized sigma24 family protein